MTGRAEHDAPTRRVLAVDDNRIILQVVEDYFGARGFEVWRAADGVQALALVRRRGLPDAVIADVLMPVMDGWAFYAALREIPGAGDLPFVFLTVEAHLPQRLRGLRLGADDYVVKPFDVEELFVRVERLIARHDGSQGAAGQEVLLSGTVEHLAISDLLQILSLNGKDGSVHLREGDNRGRIDFEGGDIVHAECGRIRGTKALYRMLGWTRAEFRVVPRSGGVAERSVDGPTAGVLMEGLVSLDEWHRLTRELPPPHARLEIAADAKERLQGNAVSGAEFEMLSRAKRGATVAQALEESPRPDAELAEALCSLLSRGVLSTSPAN